MSNKLLVVAIGEFGWELMTIQARARYETKKNGYAHVAVCTSTSSYDLYRDFAHEFITHTLPGTPLCNHRRISTSEPRINSHWLKTHNHFGSYADKGYDILYPPEEQPDVRTTSKDQEFIKFGQAKTGLGYDILIHARARSHMGHNNWSQVKWEALAQRLHKQDFHMAVIGTAGEAMANISHTGNKLDLPLKSLMDLMASSRLVIGPSSGPICLASLCGTPQLTWFGSGRYAGALLRDRFLNYWNPLKTKCWPLQIGWQPTVDTLYAYIMSAAEELEMVSKSVYAPSNPPPKENPRKRAQATSKPAERVAVPRQARTATQKELLAGRAERVRQQRARLVENRVRRTAQQVARTEKTTAEATRQQARVEAEEKLPELDGEYLLVRVAPGIGDFSWLYSKLCTLELPLAIQVCGGGPARTVPFAEILPWVKHASYGGLPFSTLRRRSVHPDTTKADVLKRFPNQVLHMEINTHLEAGRRVETWLPEIATDYHYEVTITGEHYEQALEAIPDRLYVAIFASGLPQIKNWNGWDEVAWCDFMQRVRSQIADLEFVLVGADWDKVLAARIEQRAKQMNMPFTNLAGALHIASSLYVIQASTYFVSFPSGLSILSDVMNCPATMFYPTTLVNMPGSYADPKNIESGQFHETLFCSPLELVSWLKDEYKLQDRL